MSDLVNLPAASISYDRVGSGRPLVLLHGYPLNRRIWQAVALQLAAHFDVIVPDLRGFGRSTAHQSVENISDFAADTVGLLDTLDLPGAHLVGHSMGGYIALALTSMFPDRVLGLGLVSSQTLSDADDRKEVRLKAAIEIEETGTDGVAKSMSVQLAASAELRASLHTMIAVQHPHALSCAQRAMAMRLDQSLVAKHKGDQLMILHGDVDQLIPVSRARELHVLCPSAQYVELAGVGHLPMMEVPEAVAETLRSKFLRI